MGISKGGVPKRRVAACLVIVAVMAAGCGASGAAADPTASSAPAAETQAATSAPTAAPTERPLGSYEACDAAVAAPFKLIARDQESAKVVGPILDRLNAEFEAGNPGVDVVRQNETRTDLAESILAELGRKDGPDVSQVLSGRDGLGKAVTAGVLLPLSGAQAAYAWGDRWAPRTLDRMRFSDDGKTWGSGSLYGLPMTAEFVGMALNDEVGHSRPAGEPPQTLAEDMKDLALVKDAGVVPILVGAADGDMLYVYEAVLGALVTPEWLDGFVYGRQGATFDTAEAVAAAKLLVEMRDKGFFAEGYEAASTGAAFEQFVGNKAQWLATGTWTRPALHATGRPFAFSTWKPEKAGTIPLTPGGTGLPWVVRKTSANPGCASAYLDWITSDHAMELIAADGLALPSHVSSGALGTDQWYRDYLSFPYRDLESANRLGHYLDQAFPAGRATFQTNLAKLLAKELTPEEFAKAIDTEYQAYLAGRS